MKENNFFFLNRLMMQNSDFDHAKLRSDFFSHLNYSDNRRKLPDKKMKKTQSMYFTQRDNFNTIVSKYDVKLI